MVTTVTQDAMEAEGLEEVMMQEVGEVGEELEEVMVEEVVGVVEAVEAVEAEEVMVEEVVHVVEAVEAVAAGAGLRRTCLQTYKTLICCYEYQLALLPALSKCKQPYYVPVLARDELYLNVCNKIIN